VLKNEEEGNNSRGELELNLDDKDVEEETPPALLSSRSLQ